MTLPKEIGQCSHLRVLVANDNKVLHSSGNCACEPLAFSRLPEFAAHVVSSSPHYLQSSANAQH